MINFKDMSVKEKVLFAVSPSTYLIGKGAEKAVEKVQELSQKGATIQEIREATARQELMMQLRASQAKVEQELAIAQRINTAETVEIEEFYEASGKGGLNVQSSESGVTGCLSGEGSKVTRRIYRFNGWHEGATQVLEKQFEQDEQKLHEGLSPDTIRTTELYQAERNEISAVDILEDRLTENRFSYSLKILQNPFAAIPIPTTIFNSCKQFILNEVTGTMKWINNQKPSK